VKRKAVKKVKTKGCNRKEMREILKSVSEGNNRMGVRGAWGVSFHG
jgi:hypothetical protein